MKNLVALSLLAPTLLTSSVAAADTYHPSWLTSAGDYTTQNFDQPIYAEDNQVFSKASYPQLYKKQYSHSNNPKVYYGYHDYYGYWHDYTDSWGNPMYYYNGYYYYY